MPFWCFVYSYDVFFILSLNFDIPNEINGVTQLEIIFENPIGSQSYRCVINLEKDRLGNVSES